LRCFNHVPHDVGSVGAQAGRDYAGIEVVCLAPASGNHRIEAGTERGAVWDVGQTHAYDVRLPGAHFDQVMRGRLRADVLRIHCVGAAVHDVVVDPILHIGHGVRRVRDALSIGLILREQQLERIFAVDEAVAELRIDGADDVGTHIGRQLAQRRAIVAVRVAPGVAEPERRQHVQHRGFRPAIAHGDLHQDVFGSCLGVLDEHVEVAIPGEDPGVQQLVFELVAPPRPVGAHQVVVGIGALRVLVQVLEIRVRRRRVEVEVVFLDVLAVIAFAIGESEQPLLQDRIGAVPQRQRDAQPLPIVGQSRQAVFTPAVGAGARLIVREVIPGVSALAVVLTHRAPLSLAQVRTPASPLFTVLSCPAQPLGFVIAAHEQAPATMDCC
jgi:hypothetical protein